MTKFKRSSGALLHPTSLPGPYGIGDFGEEAYRWIDFLDETGTGLWQLLPLGPTGFADSPYQNFSAFAGNPLLISIDGLCKEGLISKADLRNMPRFLADQVDFGGLIPWKMALLEKAYAKFVDDDSHADDLHFFNQCSQSWLDDYALFMALKEAHNGLPWVAWEPKLRLRDAGALDAARATYREAVDRHRFYQFMFFRQWQRLRAYAAEKNVKIIGDVPIYVSHDSSDVWSNPDLFLLDESGQPTAVAGVPPDYFTPTGQLWGNPLYRWEVHKADGFEWWVNRMRAAFELFDIVRLDHFRGFVGYWEVPADHETAEYGHWVSGPGEDLFNALLNKLGDLPLIAEDLGEITPEVFALRDKFGFPGMKILQFAFDGDPNHPFLPENYPENSVVYTGTHDNEPVMGWYQNAEEQFRQNACEYLSADEDNIYWKMIEAIWRSRAVMAIAPMQDLLGLGNEARMNLPGQKFDNWAWRMQASDLDEALRGGLKELNRRSKRFTR